MWGIMECAVTNDEQLFYGDLVYEPVEDARVQDAGCDESSTVAPTPTPSPPLNDCAALQDAADLDAATIQTLEQQATASAQTIADHEATIQTLEQQATASAQTIADHEVTIQTLQATIATLEQAAADAHACPGDILPDGHVNTEDLLALLAAFGRIC
jgi:TolA-binding protein